MQIIQYALIEIVHKFYTQSVIALCTAILKFMLLIYSTKLQVTVHGKQVSFKNK